MALQIRKSNPNKPVRIMVYGVEGIGKSTLGAKSEKPIFVTPEGGTDQLKDANGNPVDEMTGISNFSSIRKNLALLLNEKHDYKTLVLDSADWVEKLCHAQIIGDSGKSIITCNGGYGSGYRQSESMHRELIEDLSSLREKRDMNILILAHAHVKPVKDPSMPEDYDQFEIKTHDFVSSLYREWVDGLFFVRFRTFIKSNEDTTKARALGDGSRVLYTVKQPSFQAKNRYGLPPEMDFTENFWNEFMTFIRKNPQAEMIPFPVICEKLESVFKMITDDNLKKKVRESVEKAGNDVAGLNAIYNRLLTVTKGAA